MANPLEQDVFPQKKKRHQEWRRGYYGDIDRYSRWFIWRELAMMYIDGYGSVGMGELS